MIVMKFGGTSVESAEAIERVAGIVRGRLDRCPVVVVSAMSKATDQLLAMANAAGVGDKDRAVQLCRELGARHLSVAAGLVKDASHPIHNSVVANYASLEKLLEGICAVGELTPRTQDNVVAYGERINSEVVAAAFCGLGIKATHVDARDIIVTDKAFSRAVPQVPEIDRRLHAKVKPLIESGAVPVLGGFIGSTTEGITTTIGRGGSDFSAALVGAGLHADAIEIWTDVDGMKTTDPNLCPDAHRIKIISFEEAAELAYFGAKVLHPATVLPAIEKNIPVYVLNSRNPANEGTKIVARAPQTRHPFKAIAAKKRITVIDVVAARMLMAHGFLRQIFEIFDRHKCAVDVVSTSEVSVSLTVDSNERIPEIAADMEKLAFVKYSGRKAIVCLVGENLRERPGVAAQVFSAISDINVRMISQGASEINITFVIDEADVPEAVRRLHAHFFTDLDPEVFD
ncbi:MAG TPA: lysine-sensitive aspartokinase 3 [Candidatus Koribacter sp.]|jgi:aspartate kinase